ncbi:hypothetical protein HK101_001221 [Irineochytrium annulatum]|nr:hypothetical protein HK101_001221 [Irineochytrium annulatum]
MAYITDARDNGHWFARIFLMIVNLFTIALGVVTTLVGLATLGYANTTTNFGNTTQTINVNGTLQIFGGDANSNIGGSHLTTDIKTIGIILLAYGCFIFVSSLCGCIGACTRNIGVLSCYMGTLSFDVVLTLAASIYGIVVVINRQKDWDGQSLQSWTQLQDYEKDFYQWEFDCCGYAQGDSAAYTGSDRFYAGEPTVNFCTPNATATKKATDYPGCHTASHDYWNRWIVYVAGGAAVAIVVLLAAIGAAHNAKRKRVIVQDDMRQPLTTGVVIIGQRY